MTTDDHPVEGTRTFQASADAYDTFMGRYSSQLAPAFADLCLPTQGGTFLDVGCGPGALTAEAADRLGATAVAAVDPTPAFVEACRSRHRGVDVRRAPAEDLPFPDDSFDAAAAQLVLHFVTDAPRAAAEMCRVVRPGGVVCAAVWDADDGPDMLRAFWDAARSLAPEPPNGLQDIRFGRPGELCALFESAGLREVAETTLAVTTRYHGFQELWETFLAGIGPTGTHLQGRSDAYRAQLREALFTGLGSPGGPFTLRAVARAARGKVPQPR